MLDYIIKVLLFQTLFLAVYDLFLKRETFFQWNRAYLIVTSLVAYVIPLLKINSMYEVIPQEYVVLLPEVMLSPTMVLEESFNWSALLFTVLTYLFWTGILIASLLFIKRLYEIISIINTHEKEQQATYSLVKLEDNNAFSFFKYIFLGNDLSEENRKQIIAHELVHVQQKHSLDLLFFEVQKIVCWFNPFSYLFQRRVAELHEFIADSKAIKELDKKDYFQNLLAYTFGTQKIAFINPFLKFSFIKKRILMLNKHKSKQLLKFKYLLLLPLLVGMLLYSSCEKSNVDNEPVINKNEKRLITLFLGSPNSSKIEEIQSKKEGYFDVYMLGAKPSSSMEISFDNLTEEEKYGYNEFRYNKSLGKNRKFYSYKIYELGDGSKVLLEEIDWKGMKASWAEKEYLDAEEVPFAKVIKGPVFPGCEGVEDEKQCFNLKLQQYVARNFDISLSQNLGLESGKKKIYIQFVMNKNGEVLDAKARAPHKALEAEGIRLIKSLPKMQAAENENGEKIAFTYVLPISFNVE